MELTSAGKVGIGVSAPTRSLVLGKGDSTGVQTQYTNSTTGAALGDGFTVGIDGSENAEFWNFENTNMLFATNGSERSRLDSSGRFGIGTSSISSFAKLQVAGTAGAQTGASQALYITSPSTTANEGVGIRMSAASGSHEAVGIIGMVNNASGNAGSMTFHTYDGGATIPERVRINNGGDLFIGSAGVNPSASQTGFAYRGAAGGNGFIATGVGGTNALTHHAFYNPNGVVGQIYSINSGTVFATSSDYRLKENVVALLGATERLKQLKPSRFNFIADGNITVDGFLAHEVADVVPEAIVGTKDAVDADGNPDYQGIDQSKLVPLLVATIQELEARLTALENN
jgi:hypothetical protein